MPTETVDTTSRDQPRAETAAVAALLESVLLAQATELARGGQLAQAEALLRPFVEGGARSPAARDLLAKVYAQQGRLEEARDMWRQALELDPLNESFQRAARRCREPLRARGANWRGRLALAAVAVVLVAGGLGLRALVLEQRHVASQVTKLQSQLAPLVESLPPSVATARRLQGAVQKALRTDRALSPLGLQVRQEGEVTRLRGEVLEVATRFQVERRVLGIPGVKAVEMSGVTLARSYRVQSGDSLWRISRRVYGVTERKQLLADANHLTYPYALHVGQRLTIPRPELAEPTSGPQ